MDSNYTYPAPATSRFTGSAWALFGITMLTELLGGLSLGIALPWLICWKERWIKQNTYINGRQLRFDGTGGRLFGKFLLWALLCVVTAGIYSIWARVNWIRWFAQYTHFADENVYAPAAGAAIPAGVAPAPVAPVPTASLPAAEGGRTYFCPKCGRPTTQKGKLCPDCDSAARAPERTYFCPNCGKPTSERGKLCPDCAGAAAPQPEERPAAFGSFGPEGHEPAYSPEPESYNPEPAPHTPEPEPYNPEPAPYTPAEEPAGGAVVKMASSFGARPVQEAPAPLYYCPRCGQPTDRPNTLCPNCVGDYMETQQLSEDEFTPLTEQPPRRTYFCPKCGRPTAQRGMLCDDCAAGR